MAKEEQIRTLTTTNNTNRIMLNLGIIPSSYYLSAKYLSENGMTYTELKLASQYGGVLERKVSKKTRRVYYKNKNMELFNGTI